MTRAARRVLADCEIALEMLETEQNLDRWRVHWAGAVALARAVGHVLHKVDGADVHLKQKIEIAYKRWISDDPQHAIFREFIDEERNNILKEYHFNLHPLDEVYIVTMQSVRDANADEPSEVPHVFPISDNIYRPILDGYSEGDDARDVYREALDWWNAELTAIEQTVSDRDPRSTAGS